jgi:geranylgeranyl pyrophosphate synthase
MMTSHAVAPLAVSECPEDFLVDLNEFMLRLVRGDESETDCAAGPVAAASSVLSSGGHRVRARLAFHAGTALGLDSGDSMAISAAAELLHNASLVHDDLHDREKTRRGQPTVWSLYGGDMAVCTGDLLLSAAYAALAGLKTIHLLPELLALVHRRTLRVICGQCSELSTRGRQVDSMVFYEKMALAKSGALLSLPLEMAFLLADKKAWLGEVREAAEGFGLSYQVMDDIADIESDAAGDDGPRAVNALLVLQAAGHGENSRLLAREMALRRLESTIDIANRLPNNSGLFLRDLALALCQRF